MSKTLSPADFEPHIGTQFCVVGQRDILDLVAVERHKFARVAGGSAFTVFFQSPRDRLLPEGLYRITTEGGPGFELYIIPILTRPGDRQDYQCVFN
jgi:hypothetical protein